MKDHAVVVGENPHPGGAAVLCLVDRAAVHVGLDLVRVHLSEIDRETDRQTDREMEREGERGRERERKRKGERKFFWARPCPRNRVHLGKRERMGGSLDNDT